MYTSHGPLTSKLCSPERLTFTRSRSLTRSDDNSCGLVVDRNGPVVGRHAHPVVVMVGGVGQGRVRSARGWPHTRRGHHHFAVNFERKGRGKEGKGKGRVQKRK